MEIYFDEAGDFAPILKGTEKICALMGVIVPESEEQSIKADFELFVKKLSQREFVKGEPKGYLLSISHCRLLAEIMNAHSAVMLVPVTVFLGFTDPKFLETFPQQLRAVLEREGDKCLYELMRSQVKELSRRAGNLSVNQLIRLVSYTSGVMKGIIAISLFYHCRKYFSMYSPIKMVFDRTGTENSREELAFKDLVFMWSMTWFERNPIMVIKEIHTRDHPFQKLYGTKFEGQRALNISKMLRGNIHFADSKVTWQLQLADMLASLWLNVIRDYNGVRGYRPIFRLLHRNTVLPKDQPLGIIGVGE